MNIEKEIENLLKKFNNNYNKIIEYLKKSKEYDNKTIEKIKKILEQNKENNNAAGKLILAAAVLIALNKSEAVKIAKPFIKEVKDKLRKADLGIYAKIKDSINKNEPITEPTLFRDKKGRILDIESYQRMLLRTIATTTQNKVVISETQNRGSDLVRMSNHATSCPKCAIYQGRIYSISGKDKRYPPLSLPFEGDRMIIHPNCLHRIFPYIESKDKNAVKNMEKSNEPFTDNRSESDKQKYQDLQKINVYTQRKRKYETRLQFEPNNKRLVNAIKDIKNNIRTLRRGLKGQGGINED